MPVPSVTLAPFGVVARRAFRAGRSLVVRTALVAALPLLACGATHEAGSPRTTPGSPKERAAAAQRAADARDATIVSHVPPGTFGPHLVMDRGRRLAVWAIGLGARQGLYSLALPDERAPGAAQRLGDVLPGLELVRVRPDGTVGFVVLTSRKAGEQVVLEARQLNADGTLRGGPRVLAETPADVLWLDAVPTGRGVLVLWAERNGEQADVYAVPLGVLGIEASPRRQVRGALSWQVASFGGAAVLATVEAGAKGRDVVVRFLADDGQSSAPAVELARGVDAALDLDLAVASDRTIVGFSQRFGFERRLMLAALERSGSLGRAARPATPPRGDQKLVSLVGGAGSNAIYAVWEEARRAPLRGRRLELGRVRDDATFPEGPDASLEIASDPLLPAFAATPHGLSIAARTVVCRAGASREECSKAEPVPTLTLLDETLRSRATSPVVLKPFDDAPPDLVWDLGFEGKSLWALTARNRDPAPVLVQRFEASKSSVAAAGAPALPRVLADQGALEVPDLVDLDVWPGEGRTVVTWLSYFDPNTPYVRPSTPAPDGKREPVRAILRSEAVLGERDEQGAERLRKADEQETTISYRAHSLGGLASASSASGERLLVWSALDAGQPEVFVTLLDRAGKKVKQRMLTRAPGDVTDVAVASVTGGWLVSWVDGRGGKSEVYAARLDERIETVGQERALTNGAESPTGVQVLARGERVLALWSDARGASRPGYGDIYLASLAAKDGSLLGAPLKLAATEKHSYVPVLTARSDGAALAFLEGEPDVEGSRDDSVFAVELDGEGRALAAPTRLALEGRPTSLALSCDTSCRLAITLESGRRSELWGATFSKTSFGAPQLLSVLSLPPDQAVAPVFSGDLLYYVDAFGGDERVVRRIEALWR